MPRPCLAVLTLLASVVPAGAAEAPLVCYGNEPSWSLDLAEDGSAQLALLGEEATEYRGSETHLEPLREKAWRGRMTGGAGGELVVFIREAVCSDGMSDQKRPLTARVSLPDGRLLAGCCRTSTFRTVTPSANAKARPGDGTALGEAPARPATPTAPAAPADWASSITDYIPALRACIFEAMRAEALVFAERRDKGIIHLVLRLPGKTYADCESPNEGSAKISPRPRNAPLSPEESAILVTLFPGEAPRGRCDRSEPAFDEKGNPFGWITRKVC